MDNTYIAAVRFKDKSKLKFHVSNVPDDMEAIRGIINKELKEQSGGVQSIVIRIDSIQ